MSSHATQFLDVARAELAARDTEIARLTAAANELRNFIHRMEGLDPREIQKGPGKDSVSEEYRGKTQTEAIAYALETYGPQTTRELYDRLVKGGLPFKKVSYVTALMHRLNGRVKKATDGKRYEAIATQAGQGVQQTRTVFEQTNLPKFEVHYKSYSGTSKVGGVLAGNHSLEKILSGVTTTPNPSKP